MKLAIGSEAPPSQHPNLVIVLADDMNWRDCGPYVGRSGGIASLPASVTPNIDALAAQGLTFNHAFS